MSTDKIATTTAPASLATAHRLAFSPAQERIIRRSFLSGATEEEAGVLLEVARLRGLNPITRQIHFVKRSTWNAETRQREDVWAFQVSIDGLRAIAERTGMLEGSDEPETTADADGQPLISRVRVWRSDRKRPSIGVARFSEYAQTTKDGALTKMWREKPFLMLEKCAEALALRKAFPEELSSFVEAAEMESATPSDEPAKVAQLAPVVSPMLPPAPAGPAIDDRAELADLSAALESCADARTLAKVVASIGTAFGEGRISTASRETLLSSYKARKSALKAAAAAAAPPPVSPSAETLPAPAEPEPNAPPRELDAATGDEAAR